MSLHLTRYRQLELQSGTPPEKYPAPLVATVTLAPEDAFGVDCKHRTTIRRADNLGVELTVDTGEGFMSLSGDLIEKVCREESIGDLTCRFEGNILTVRHTADSFDDAQNTTRVVSHVFPALLSLHLHTYVWVKEFHVVIGAADYRFVALEMRPLATLASRGEQEEKLGLAVAQFARIRDPAGRLASALCYFRQALRLERTMPGNETFVAEVILNLSKAIEAIFTNNRDALRERARRWGLGEAEIEGRIIPLLLIRNKIDVAHAASGLLTRKERDTLLDFAGTAVDAVGRVLEKMLADSCSGAVTFESWGESVAKDKADLLRQLRAYLSAAAKSKGDAALPE